MFSFQILILVILGVGSSAYAQTTPPLMIPCANREQNYRDVQQVAKNLVPDVCLRAIKEGMDACLPGPVETDEDRVTMSVRETGLRKDAATLLEGYRLGQVKYEGKASICASSHTKVKDTCGEISASYLKALKSNHADEEARKAQITQLPAGPDRFNALTENTREHQVINTQLYAQRDQTSRVTAVALKALNEAAQCNANQSRLYAEALDPSNDRLASMTALGDSSVRADSGEPANSPPSPANDPTPRVQSNLKDSVVASTATKAAETLEHAAENSAGAIGASTLKTARTLAKSTGVGSMALSVQENDPLGATSSFVTTASEFITPANAAKVGIGGAFFTVLLHTSNGPKALCATIHTDPVEAYRLGCEVSSPAGARANENAVSTLASQ